MNIIYIRCVKNTDSEAVETNIEMNFKSNIIFFFQILH